MPSRAPRKPIEPFAGEHNHSYDRPNRQSRTASIVTADLTLIRGRRLIRRRSRMGIGRTSRAITRNCDAATGLCYVMPGGSTANTHLEMPLQMAKPYSSGRFESGTPRRALSGGNHRGGGFSSAAHRRSRACSNADPDVGNNKFQPGPLATTRFQHGDHYCGVEQSVQAKMVGGRSREGHKHHSSTSWPTRAAPVW